MVKTLEAALEKESINVLAFKPNHFATLSVYFAKFLSTDQSRPQDGLRRWAFGLKQYIPGSVIEPADERRDLLASQCLPRHYLEGGVSQPVLGERAD